MRQPQFQEQRCRISSSSQTSYSSAHFYTAPPPPPLSPSTPTWQFSKRASPRTETPAQRERALKLLRIGSCKYGESVALRTFRLAGRSGLAERYVALPRTELQARQR